MCGKNEFLMLEQTHSKSTDLSLSAREQNGRTDVVARGPTCHEIGCRFLHCSWRQGRIAAVFLSIFMCQVMPVSCFC